MSPSRLTFAEPIAVISSRLSLPASRQHPFGLGIALSSGLWIPPAFRRLAFASRSIPFPLEIHVRYRSSTALSPQTPSGLLRSAPTRYDRGGCPLCSGALVSLTHPPKEMCPNMARMRRLCQPISGARGSRSFFEGSFAFTRPVFPLPVAPRLAWFALGLVPLAQDPAVTSDAKRGGNRRWTLA